MVEELSIGIGLFINMIFVELIGLTAGGMVVPGYIALHLDSPMQVGSTLLISFTTYSIIRYLAHYIIIYGRRLLMFSILLGFILSRLFNFMTDSGVFIDMGFHMKAVGVIIPGLIAYWMERQGVIESICGMITGSVITRLILLIIVGGHI